MMTKAYKAIRLTSKIAPQSGTLLATTDMSGNSIDIYARSYDTNPSIADAVISIYGSLPHNRTTDVGKIGFLFGAGTTPPTEDDTNIESIINDFTYVTYLYTPGLLDADGKYVEIAISYTYTGQSEAQINELALYGEFWTFYSNSGSNYACSLLMDRTVLDTPITVQPGETITVSAKFYEP